MEVLTQTQERKLWQSIITGNEHAIKWHEILTAFAGLGMDRQLTALKKVPLEKLLMVRELHDVTFKLRESEVTAHKERKNAVKEIKELMESQGVSIGDLTSLEPKVEPKKKYSQRYARVTPEEFLKYLVARAENGIVTDSSRSISDSLNVGVSTVYARLSSLTKSGHLVNLGRNGYQIVSGG